MEGGVGGRGREGLIDMGAINIDRAVNEKIWAGQGNYRREKRHENKES